jgi:hypothetical protein
MIPILILSHHTVNTSLSLARFPQIELVPSPSNCQIRSNLLVHMEVAGFVIGTISAVGLAGLYSTAVQVLDQIDAARHLDKAANPLFARFIASKHLLSEWGTRNGIQNGKLNPPYHPAFDDDSARRVIFLLLANIENIMADQKRLYEKYGMGTIPSSADVGGVQREMEFNTARPGWARRARWAITDQRKFGSLVGELEAIIDRLFKLATPREVVSSDDLMSKLEELKNYVKSRI